MSGKNTRLRLRKAKIFLFKKYDLIVRRGERCWDRKLKTT